MSSIPRSQKLCTWVRRSAKTVGLLSDNESKTLIKPLFSPTKTRPSAAKATVVGSTSPEIATWSENPLGGTPLATVGADTATASVALARPAGAALASAAGDNNAAPMSATAKSGRSGMTARQVTRQLCDSTLTPCTLLVDLSSPRHRTNVFSGLSTQAGAGGGWLRRRSLHRYASRAHEPLRYPGPRLACCPAGAPCRLASPPAAVRWDAACRARRTRRSRCARDRSSRWGTRGHAASGRSGTTARGSRTPAAGPKGRRPLRE